MVTTITLYSINEGTDQNTSMVEPCANFLARQLLYPLYSTNEGMDGAVRMRRSSMLVYVLSNPVQTF